jgi:hypothetical protein
VIFVIVGFVSLAGACQSEVPVFEALSFIECVRGVLHVSRMLFLRLEMCSRYL